MNAGIPIELIAQATLSDMEHLRTAQRGLDDGLAERPARSHAQTYTDAYLRGRLFARAQRREIALTFGEACRCPACGSVCPGEPEAICCCTPNGTPMRYGLEALYGPGDPDDDCQFFSPGELRRLCQDGVQVLSLEGECLNPQILVQ